MNNFESLIIRLKSILESKSEDIIKIRTLLDTIKEKEIEYLDNNYNNFMKAKKELSLNYSGNNRIEREALTRKQQAMDSDFSNNKMYMRNIDSGIKSLYRDLIPYINDEFNNSIIKIDNFSYEFNLNIPSHQNLLTQDFILFEKDILDYKEDLIYKKKINDHTFIIKFLSESNNDLKIKEMELSVISNCFDFINTLNIKIDFLPKIIIKSIFNSTPVSSVQNKNYIESLKIEDLFNLDCKDHKDLSLIATDTLFEFKSGILYEVFKEGFADFIQMLEKEITNNNKKENRQKNNFK